MPPPPVPSNILASTRAYWRTFRTFAGARLWRAVALLIVISLLEGSGLLLLVPLLHALGFTAGAAPAGFGSLTGLLKNHSSPASLALLLGAFIAVKAIQSGLRAWSSMCTMELETDFVCDLRERFYRAMIGADWLFVTRQRTSDLTQSLLVELPMVGVGTRQLLTLLSMVFIALVQVGIAFYLSPAMTGLALGAGLVVGLGLRRLRRRSFALGQLGHGKRAEMASAVTEHLAGMKIAKSHGREPQHFTHFQRAMHDIADHAVRLHRLGTLTSIWIEVGAVVAMSVFVWCAVVLQHVPTAQLLVLVFVFTRLLSHVTLLQNLWHQVMHALPPFVAAQALQQQLEAAAEPPPPAATQPLTLAREIRVDDLTFRYDPTRASIAVQGINLSIPARQVTALCGPSGAGKSTLADLLLGLLAPSAGRIRLDDRPLAGEMLHHWRRSIGYVPQETFLFHDTVRANLLWARPEATEAELREALRSAAAESFVDRLPSGLDTIVGDRGVRISGGERQRIALARALLRRPTLLVLDEATSSLDTQNERLVQDAIERLHGELTIVLIAHRLSTVRMADQIVVLEAGRIAETGSWAELSARTGGVFQKLVAADTGR